MASSREDWQAIGKRRQAVGKRSSESRGRIGEFARRTHAENSRRTSLGNLLASHRGEVRPKAAEVQNHSRYGNCSFSPSFPALAPSVIPVCPVRRALFPSGKLFKLTIVTELFRVRFEMPGSRSLYSIVPPSVIPVCT